MIVKTRELTESLNKLYEAYEVETEDELDAIMDDDTLSDEEKEAEIGRILDKHDKLNEDVEDCEPYTPRYPSPLTWYVCDSGDDYYDYFYKGYSEDKSFEVDVWPVSDEYSVQIFQNGKCIANYCTNASDDDDAINRVSEDFKEEFLAESLNESCNKLNESCDGWIAFYNGKKLEIPKSDVDGGIYEAKQKAIKELKVPKSKIGLLSIKPAYNESLNEAQLNENPLVAAAARAAIPAAIDVASNAISSAIDAKLHDGADNLEEDFYDPTSWFYDLVNNYETWSGEEWNSWSQEERDAAVTKAMKHFLIDNQLSEEEAEEFKRDLTDNNFHTECKIFSELYGII